MAEFDLAVIGAGAAGLSVTAVAAQLGLRVALIERGRMGGDCLNTGCVPSKALLAAAHAAMEARAAGRFGLRIAAPGDRLGRGAGACARRHRRHRADRQRGPLHRASAPPCWPGEARFVAPRRAGGRAAGRAAPADRAAHRHRRRQPRRRCRRSPAWRRCRIVTNETLFDLLDRARRIC